MKSLPLAVLRPPAWRRCGAMLALAASLSFAFQSTLVMAQVSAEPDVLVQTKPKPAKHAKKHVPKAVSYTHLTLPTNREV